MEKRDEEGGKEGRKEHESSSASVVRADFNLSLPRSLRLLLFLPSYDARPASSLFSSCVCTEGEVLTAWRTAGRRAAVLSSSSESLAVSNTKREGRRVGFDPIEIEREEVFSRVEHLSRPSPI